MDLFFNGDKAKSFFEDAGREVTVIKLSGALEIAPVLGLADVIVDIVESGNTLSKPMV